MSYSFKYKRKNDSPWQYFLHKLSRQLELLDTPTLITTATIFTYIFVVLAGVYVLLRRVGVLPPNAFRRLLWRIFVYSIPPSIVLALERREQSGGTADDPFEDENSYATTRTFGAKSLAVKKILGMGISSLTGMPGAGASIGGTAAKRKTQALPGLFNRDNECYQNSIIQGLASLSSFCDFVEKLPSESPVGGHATLTGALQAIIAGLNSSDNHGRGLWTPWALKSMSSWQQQDAQEYFSRVIDEVEKDIRKTLKAEVVQEGSLSLAGLELSDGKPLDGSRDMGLLNCATEAVEPELAKLRNPLEGLQAQRVGCLQCGYVEGLSLIPFNCITVSLGRKNHYDLEGLFDSNTDLETIPGVECGKCTLLKQEKILHRLIQSRAQDDGTVDESLQSRLEAVETALRDQDFSEATLSKKCLISGKARVTTDKTKQSVIARAPQSLVIHVNRSVFDERTGTQLKNYAQVQYPKLLNFDQWCLGASQTSSGDAETWETDPSVSMIEEATEKDTVDEKLLSEVARLPRALYTLRALITHYGTHGDGHYVAWRQDPEALKGDSDTNTWWRLSDEDVVQFDEDTVLKQGGVFMLFYERVNAADFIQSVPVIEPMDEPAAAEIKELDSPTNFLSPEAQAALDAKLDTYITPKEIPIKSSNPSPAKQSKSNGVASAMRTASETTPIKLESVNGVLNIA